MHGVGGGGNWTGGHDFLKTNGRHKILFQNNGQNYIFLILEGDMQDFCVQDGGDEKKLQRNKKSPVPLT